MSIFDLQIEEHLTKLGIPHTQPPYLHLYNNNHSVTDQQNFFIKLWTDKRSLQIELETSRQLTYAPKPLTPTLTNIDEQYLYTTEYIPSTNLNYNTVTPTDINTIISQLQQIHNLPLNTYTQPRQLSETLNLTTNRLTHPHLTPTQHEQLTLLIDTHIKPYIQKHQNTTTYAHTDLKLDNILKTPREQIHIIDYESIKHSPVEADLASLYQSIYQSGHPDLYHQFYQAFQKAYPNLNHQTLKESILFKNTLTTTAAIKLAPHILNQRIDIMLETLDTNSVPAYLPNIL